MTVDCIEADFVLAAGRYDKDVGDTVILVPSCVMVMVRVNPPPVTVTVPVRDDWPVFADTLMFICVVLLALPLEGLIVIQVWFLEAVQLTPA